MSSPLDFGCFDRTLDSWLLLHWTATCQSFNGSQAPCYLAWTDVEYTLLPDVKHPEG